MRSTADYSRRGAKEEIRAAVLRTYLLRLREEQGKQALTALLDRAAVAEKAVEDERAWLSEAAAVRVLAALERALGEGALRDRGRWATAPEALGTWVRLLRGARYVADGYVYLADNSAEESRLGALRIATEVPMGEGRAGLRELRMVFARNEEDDPPPASTRAEGERLLCDARVGTLRAMPELFGLPPAIVEHSECLGRGGAACRYVVRWAPASDGPHPLLVAAPFAAIAGGAAGYVGTPLSGAIAAACAGALGAFLGQSRRERRQAARTRTFEELRLRALERGLALKGGLEDAPIGDLIGTALGGKYRVTRKLGSGGIGAVYAAEHLALGHEVAVKVLRGAAASDASEIARLRREAYIQTRIEHPAIVKVHDLDQMPDGSLYVVMDRLVGRPLSDRLTAEGRLPAAVCLPWFIDVCAGLAAAHGIGAVHRDLKPGNIFLCEDGSTKILDFGMSKLGAAEALTQEGYTLGTPEYMAPEQCVGGAVGPATDLYALGVLMYETLTGELPIRAANRRDLLDLHQSRLPDPLGERYPELAIPPAFDAAIMRCLEKNPAHRPASASALAELLAAVPREAPPAREEPETLDPIPAARPAES